MKSVLLICAAILLWLGPASAESAANGKPCRGPASNESEGCASKSCAPGPTINVAVAADPHYCRARERKCAWPGSGGEDFGTQGRREKIDYYCCNPQLFGYPDAPAQFWPVKCRRADGGPMPLPPPTPPTATLPAQPAANPSAVPRAPARAPGAPLPLTR